MMHSYTIIRCSTSDKKMVMDLLCDADEYELIRDHVDVVYYNGDNPKERRDTQKLIKENIKKLMDKGVHANAKPENVYDWLFIRLHR